MVATPEPNKVEFLGHRFGETKARLDRLGAAREQLYVGDAFGQSPADQFEETGASVGREATEGDAVELFPEALDIMGMAVTKAADGNASDEIKIFVAVDICNRAAPGMIDGDLRIE